MWLTGNDESGDRQIRIQGLPIRNYRRYLFAGVTLVVIFGIGLSGCSPRVKVEAPDKPIEINVNVKIEQEVRIKLDRAVDRTLAENPELFGTGNKP